MLPSPQYQAAHFADSLRFPHDRKSVFFIQHWHPAKLNNVIELTVNLPVMRYIDTYRGNTNPHRLLYLKDIPTFEIASSYQL